MNDDNKPNRLGNKIMKLFKIEKKYELIFTCS